MTAIAVALAEQVEQAVRQLSDSGAFMTPVAIVRHSAPVEDMDLSLHRTKVGISPGAVELTRVSRQELQRRWTVSISVMRLVDNEQEVETLMEVVEQLIELFATGVTVFEFGDVRAAWVECVNDPTYVAADREESDVFLSIIRHTFLVRR